MVLSASYKRARPILQIIKNLQLDTLFPQRIIIWENAANQSTLQLMVTSYFLAKSYFKYQIH